MHSFFAFISAIKLPRIPAYFPKTGYPRVSCGFVFIFIRLRIFFCAVRHILYRSFFPSSRILTAAFTSRSIRFPHSQTYILSDNANSFSYVHIHCKSCSMQNNGLPFIRCFPRSSSLYPSMDRNCPYPLSCTPFPRCSPPDIPCRFRSSTHTASYLSASSCLAYAGNLFSGFFIFS